MSDLIGKDVDVYFNLHRKCWSVRDRKTRRVIAHLNGLVLSDVAFRVSAAGNARVRREGRKNVHAFARGTVIGTEPVLPPYGTRYVNVAYNPYRFTTFVVKGSETPIHEARRAWFDSRAVMAEFDTATHDVVR